MASPRPTESDYAAIVAGTFPGYVISRVHVLPASSLP